MDYIKYIDGVSGSSGNCHVLFIERLSTVILLDIGIPYKHVQALMSEIKVPIEQVIVAVTHEHNDHYSISSYQALKRDYPGVIIMFDKMYCVRKALAVRKYSTDYLKISYKNYKHGQTESSVYLIEVTLDGRTERVAYGTDLDGGNTPDLIVDSTYDNLDLFILESNYDVRYAWDVMLHSDYYAGIGYDVNSGFVRHLSNSEHDLIIKAHKPKEAMAVHKSSRFGVWKLNDDNEICN